MSTTTEKKAGYTPGPWMRRSIPGHLFEITANGNPVLRIRGGMMKTRLRRKYYKGTCQDCGWHKSVTTIYFWATGMRYVVCAECIKAYRKVILAPCSPSCTHSHAV